MAKKPGTAKQNKGKPAVRGKQAIEKSQKNECEKNGIKEINRFSCSYCSVDLLYMCLLMVGEAIEGMSAMKYAHSYIRQHEKPRGLYLRSKRSQIRIHMFVMLQLIRFGI